MVPRSRSSIRPSACNTAAYDGGGISGADLAVTNSTASGNTAMNGGGIYGGDLTLTNSRVGRNAATGGLGGGGIFTLGGSTTLVNSTVDLNTAVAGGGGIFNFGQGADSALSPIPALPATPRVTAAVCTTAPRMGPPRSP